MPNTNAPFGFRPVRRVDSAAVTFAMDTRNVATSDTTQIGYGDVVKQLASGFITRATSSDNALADPGIYGVFYGCEYFDTALQRKVWSANWTGVATALTGTILAKCIIDPNIIFEVQNGSSTAITFADIGANIGILNGTVATNGMSTQSIDQSTILTTITLPFHITGISQKVGNDTASGFGLIEVKLNNSVFNSRTGI